MTLSPTGWVVLVAALLVLLRGRAMYAVKPGVVLESRPEMEYARRIVARVWTHYGYTATVTSGIDGIHAAQSLHVLGLAEDYRTRDVRAGDLTQMVAVVRATLGRDYDVVVESDHLHVEYDPK